MRLGLIRIRVRVGIIKTRVYRIRVRVGIKIRVYRVRVRVGIKIRVYRIRVRVRVRTKSNFKIQKNTKLQKYKNSDSP